MLAPWATISCCSGSSHCSALCNYTVYNQAFCLVLSFYVTFSFVFHRSSSPLDASYCWTRVSPTTVPPGAKVAFEQPSSRLHSFVPPSPSVSFALLHLLNCSFNNNDHFARFLIISHVHSQRFLKKKICSISEYITILTYINRLIRN